LYACVKKLKPIPIRRNTYKQLGVLDISLLINFSKHYKNCHFETQ